MNAYALKFRRARLRNATLGALVMGVCSLASFVLAALKVTSDPLTLVTLFSAGCGYAMVTLLCLIDASEQRAALAQARFARQCAREHVIDVTAVNVR